MTILKTAARETIIHVALFLYAVSVFGNRFLTGLGRHPSIPSHAKSKPLVLGEFVTRIFPVFADFAASTQPPSSINMVA